MELEMLVIAPHPDDAELGMGGAIAKWVQAGQRVGILDLTTGEPTPFGSEEIRARETAAASQALGVQWRENLGLPNRSLEATLDARRRLAEVFRRVKPKWLFAPYWEDAHPDHLAATELVETARFWSKLTKTDMDGEPFHPKRIFYYYCVHLRLATQPAFILDISDAWEKKKAAIAAYQSQFVQGREEMKPSFIERLEEEAGYWGKLIGTRYGEPYASREPLGVQQFDSFVD